MCESRWTFYDPQSGTQTLGLYHGADSGHVLVFHNSNVLIIDFGIRESKSYTIQHNDSLITLGIERAGSSFDYTFHRKSLYPEETLLGKFKNCFSWKPR